MFIQHSDNPQDLYIVEKEGFETWIAKQPKKVQTQIALNLADTSEGSIAQWIEGSNQKAVLIMGNSVFASFGRLAEKLQKSDWQIKGDDFN